MVAIILARISALGGSTQQWFVRSVLIMLVAVPMTASARSPVMPLEDDGGGGGSAAAPHELAAIRLFDDVLSQRVPGVCAQLMSSDVVSHTPVGDVDGPDAFERYVADAWRAFPDATFRIDERVSSGDRVTVRWTMTGHHLERFGDLPATGARVVMHGLAVFRFEGGMIAETWLQYDRMALVEQIEAGQVSRDLCPPCVLP